MPDSIRWWPAVVIVALMAILLAYLWLAPMPSDQHRMTLTFPTLFFGVLFLALWLVLFSRLSKRFRFRAFLGIAALTAAVLVLFEIQGVDGNLRPIVGFRWAGERTFEGASRAAPVATGTGPADYPQFYGPNRDATLDGPRLERDWSAHPPEELWRREVGEGWSSFAVVGNAALTQEQRGDLEVVVRYDLATGEQVWVHEDRAPFNTTVGGSGPRATPTVAGDTVYTLGATGILNALDLASGARLWTRNVLADNGAGQPDWGMPSSPLLVGELVVVQLGRNGTSLAAYDRATGEPRWRAGTDTGTYSTPALAEVAGRRQILIVNQNSVAGHDPVTGEMLWSEPWVQASGEKVTPPLQLGDDRLLVSAGYGVGSRLLHVRPDGDGFVVEELWSSPRLKSKFAPMVFHEGVVYGLDDGVLVALDPETGERLWKRGRYGHGQFILVGELLLILTEKGDLVLVEANPEEHRELATFPALDGKTWNPPALSGDLLLVRNNKEAACYRLPVAG